MSNFEGEPRAPRSQETRKGSRFNEEVGVFLEHEFEEHGDVRQDFVTHALPLQNLRGIVEEGGLRTTAFLEKKGKKIRKGGEGWALGGQGPGNAGADPTAIYFGQGFIDDTYTVRTGSEVALLFPAQEFERLRRLQKDSGPALSNENKITNAEYDVRSRERFSDAGLGSVAESTKNIAKKKEIVDLEKCAKKYEQMRGVFGSAFERKVDSLGLEDLPREWKFVEQNDALVRSQLDQLEKKTQKDLQKAEEELPSFRRESETAHLKEMQTGAEEARERLRVSKQPRGFVTRAIGRFTGKTSQERGEQESIERWLEEQNKRITESGTLLGAGPEAQQKLERIKEYRTAVLEFERERRNLAKEAYKERQQIEKAYETFNMRGEKARVIQERVRTMYQTQEAEDALQADLSHGIVLVEKRHVAEVREALRDKPGLISRVVVFDRNHFNVENRLSGLNTVFEHLASNKADVELLVAAQRGDGGAQSSVDGVWRLEDYTEAETEDEIRKAA
ncbi:MAG: hypothetical protein AAB579_02580 [Patescibacteria group bacterium]